MRRGGLETRFADGQAWRGALLRQGAPHRVMLRLTTYSGSFRYHLSRGTTLCYNELFGPARHAACPPDGVVPFPAGCPYFRGVTGDEINQMCHVSVILDFDVLTIGLHD